MGRSYGQYCAIASALDVVGERWSLLVLRELLSGPKRFKDLREGLPGIGTGLLSTRLRELEAAGVIRRGVLPAPARVPVYELTESGLELEPVLVGLARWGAGRLGERTRDQAFKPHWLLLFLSTEYRREAAAGVNETYEFEIGGELLHARVSDGEVDVRDGPAADPVLRVSADADTFLDAVSGPGRLDEALESGALRVEGDRDALRRCVEIFGPPALVEPAVAAA